MAQLISLGDLPFIGMVAFGVILSMLIITKTHMTRKTRRIIILSLFIVVSAIAAFIGARLSHTEPGTMFTRAFILLWICVSTLHNIPGGDDHVRLS